MSGCSVSFTVPGKAVGKARARITKAGHAFTPKTTAEYEALVKQMAWMAMNGRQVLEGPVRVEIQVCLPIPQSWSKKKRQEAARCIVLPTSKPDLDNVLKSILDACQEVVFHDDRQVCSLLMTKAYDEMPRVRVEVMEI